MQDYGFCFVNFELFWIWKLFSFFLPPSNGYDNCLLKTQRERERERERYERLIAYLYSFRNRKTCELTFSEMYAVLSILHNKWPKLIKSEDF
jgi:hypothetical protein